MKTLFSIFIRLAFIAAIAGAVGALVWLYRLNACAPSPFALRDSQRLEAGTNARAQSAIVLKTYGPQYPEKGFMWIPQDRAIDFVVEEWRDPVAGRSNLLWRAAIALEVPPSPNTNTSPPTQDQTNSVSAEQKVP